MRSSEDEGIIHNSLTEIALFLLFTFGVLIVASGDQSLGSSQPPKLADQFVPRDLTLPLPLPFDPSPPPKPKPPPKGPQSRPTITTNTARLQKIDAQILALRSSRSLADHDPCFLWMNLGRQGDIVVNATTVGQSGTTNTKQFVVHPLRAVSALGIFVTSRPSSSGQQLRFQVQERLGSIRANYYPTGPIRAAGLVATGTSPEYKMVSDFNSTLRQIGPTDDINNILRPVVNFMANHKLACGFHIDLHGMIFDNTGRTGGISSNLLINTARQSSNGAKTVTNQACSAITAKQPATSTLSSFSRHALDGNNKIRITNGAHILTKIPRNQLQDYCQNQRTLTKGKSSIDFNGGVTFVSPSGTHSPRLFWNSLNAANQNPR